MTMDLFSLTRRKAMWQTSHVDSYHAPSRGEIEEDRASSTSGRCASVGLTVHIDTDSRNENSRHDQIWSSSSVSSTATLQKRRLDFTSETPSYKSDSPLSSAGSRAPRLS